jgi:hypothetical protein
VEMEVEEDEDETQSKSVATFRDNTINNRCIDFTHTTRPPGGMNYFGPGFKMFHSMVQWSCSSGPSSGSQILYVNWAHLFRHVFPKRHIFLGDSSLTGARSKALRVA